MANHKKLNDFGICCGHKSPVTEHTYVIHNANMHLIFIYWFCDDYKVSMVFCSIKKYTKRKDTKFKS